MVFKVNNSVIPFSTIGGFNNKKSRISRRKSRISRRKSRISRPKSRISRRRRKSRISRRRRKSRISRRRRKSRNHKGGFIRSHSPIFNWGNKCPNTGKVFKIET